MFIRLEQIVNTINPGQHTKFSKSVRERSGSDNAKQTQPNGLSHSTPSRHFHLITPITKGAFRNKQNT